MRTRLFTSLAAAAAFTALFAGSGSSSSSSSVDVRGDVGGLDAQATPAATATPDPAEAHGLYGAAPEDHGLYGQIIDADPGMYGAPVDADPGLYGAPPVR